MIYRCSKPDKTLAVVVRDCKGVSDFMCLAGDAIGISKYETMLDNRCRHLSEEACLTSDIHFYNECRPALVGDVDLDKLKEALTRAYTVHKGNTLLHCYHGVDRTGFISAIMVALNLCTGLPHPLKELCTIGVRIFYFDSNPIFGGSSRFPALAQSYNECVNAIVPGAGVSVLTPLVNFPPLAPPPQPQTPAPAPERPVR